MTNIYFPDEEVTVNDLYFVCYMVERIARQLKQPNKYVVNTLVWEFQLKDRIVGVWVDEVKLCENSLNNKSQSFFITYPPT